jgi:carboxylesterase
MGVWLARRGISVEAPLLAGHGRTWRSLERTTWEDWYAGVEAAYERLRARCGRVFAAGLSMGGTQVIHLAEHHPELAGLVTMAPALFLRDLRAPFLPVLRLLKRTMDFSGNGVARPGFADLHYRRLPLGSVAELAAFQRHVREDVSLVRCPALLFHGRLDSVVSSGDSRWALRRISSRTKRLVTMPRSAHVLPLDWDHERMFRMILRFMKEASAL